METGKFTLDEAWVKRRGISQLPQLSELVRPSWVLNIALSRCRPLPCPPGAGQQAGGTGPPSWQRGSSDQNIRGLKNE